jgi:hypothetical protein
MNIDQSFLINKINQLHDRISLLEMKIQQYEGNNLQNNNFLNSNNSHNNILQENFINKKVEQMFINKKKEEENEIYDPLSIDYIIKKNDNTNKQKNILFTNNNNKNNYNNTIKFEVQDKVYDPLSS